MSNALVELHCHILPGIDDGAKDLDMSMSLIRKELQDGAAGIVFTPHFHYERISVEQFTARRKAAFLQVSAACRAEGLRLAGKMGAEVFYSPALPSLDLRQLAFAGSNYILIEFPTTMHPPGIDETLYAIRAQGYTPILAHVERYPFVTEDPTLLYNWVCDGCLAQINATGLIRDGHTATRSSARQTWPRALPICLTRSPAACSATPSTSILATTCVPPSRRSRSTASGIGCKTEYA